MNIKNFLNKRLNMLLFITVLYLVIGILIGVLLPRIIFNSRMKDIEGQLTDLAWAYDETTEVSGTSILYIYDDGVSTMLSYNGYISSINPDIEVHLIHWSEIQEVSEQVYYDDFQDQDFVYYIYVVRDNFYVVTFMDTSEVHNFVDTIQNFSFLSIVLLYIGSLLFASTVFSNSLVKKYSLYDPVTNLNTKLSLITKYDTKDLSKYRIIYYNIYNLEDIVDACGVRYNDDILKMVSMNIMRTFDFNSVYQVSPNEFIVLLSSTKEDALDFQAAINFRDEMMMKIAPYEFRVKAITVDIELTKDIDVSTLIKRFNYAYSKIKTTKDTYIEVNQLLIDEMDQETYYQSHLQGAIDNNKLVNYYQPKMDPKTNKLVGAEALSRWIDDDGLVPPDKFIHIAETTGLIYDVDLVAFEKSLQMIKQLREANMIDEKVRISSNFSPITLKNLTFDTIKHLVEKYKVSTSNVSIEITETVVMEFDLISDLLSKIADFGISIEIDDFSAGNSSFTILPLLKADVVKLDKAVLPESISNEREKLIYSSLVDMSHKLGFKIISEGVETKDQQEFVRDLGVEAIQGYFYSKPLKETDFIQYIKDNK